MRYIKAAHERENVLFSLKLKTQNDLDSFLAVTDTVCYFSKSIKLNYFMSLRILILHGN